MQDKWLLMFGALVIPIGMTDQLDTRFTTRIASAELKAFKKAAKLDRRSVADAVRLAMELYVEKVYRDRGRTPPQMEESIDEAAPDNPPKRQRSDCALTAGENEADMDSAKK